MKQRFLIVVAVCMALACSISLAIKSDSPEIVYKAIELPELPENILAEVVLPEMPVEPDMPEEIPQPLGNEILLPPVCPPQYYYYDGCCDRWQFHRGQPVRNVVRFFHNRQPVRNFFRNHQPVRNVFRGIGRLFCWRRC